MLCKVIVLVLALSGLFETVESAKRHFNVELHQLTCKRIGPVVKSLDCELRKLATNKFVVNAAGEFSHDITKNAEVGFLVTFQMPKNSRVVKFLDLKLSVCDFLSQVMSVPLIKRLLKEVRRSSNLPYACPIKGNFPYYMTNYTITDEILPTYSPYVNFNFSVTIFENKKPIGHSHLEGSVVSK